MVSSGAAELRFQVGRNRPAQLAMTHMNSDQLAAFQFEYQAAPGGFDFG